MRWTIVVCVVLAGVANAATNTTTTTTESSEPGNNGLGGLFTMTRGFIDLVMTKKSIISSLNDAAGDSKDYFNGNLTSSDKLSGFLTAAESTLIGYAICIAIGVVFIVVMPFVGCCFLCCRCCGNCGAKPWREKGTGRGRKTCYFVLLGIVTGVMLGAVVCIFMNNVLIHDQTSMTSDSSIIQVAEQNLNRTENYINTVVTEVMDIVAGGFEDTVDAIVNTLSETGTMARNKLEQLTNAAVILADAEKLAERLGEVKQGLSEVNATSVELRSETASLLNQLGTIKTGLAAILVGCTTAACTDLTTASDSALSLDADFTKVDDITGQLNTVLSIDWELLKENINKGNDTLENVVQNVTSITDSITTDIKNKLTTETKPTIDAQVDDSTAEIKKIVDFNNARDKLNSGRDDIDEYGDYIFYFGLALGCVTLLIVVLYALGLAFLACSSNTGSSCNQTTGISMLMAGVGFTFLFVIFLTALTLLMFMLGAPFYSMACRYTSDLADPDLTQEFDKFLDAAQIEVGHDLTISEIMMKCGRDESLYRAANLGERFDLLEYLDIAKYPELKNAINDLRNQAITIDHVDILSAATRDQLDTTIAATLENINFTSYDTQVDRSITSGDLNALVTQMNTVAPSLPSTKTAELQTLATSLSQIQTDKVTALETKKANLGTAIDNLRTTLTANGGFTKYTKDLLDALDTAARNITDNGSKLVTGIIADMADAVLKDITDILTTIANEMSNNIGRCKEPLGIIQSTVDIGCKSVLRPFNAMWFCLGWFIFFSIPGIIFAVKLVGVYRATRGTVDDDDDDNKSFDQGNYDAYNSGAATGRSENIPMSYQQSTSHENRGYQKDDYNYPDRNQRASRASRDRRQQQQQSQQYQKREYYPQQNTPANPPHYYDNRGQHY